METIKAKPIFLIGIPTENMEPLEMDVIHKSIIEQLNDYHVLVYTDISIKKIEFQCFNPPDFDPIKMDEIKKIIEDKCKQ